MVLALGLAHTQKAMQAERAVTDMTNDLLKKNADALKMGTIETAKESQRGVVDIETPAADQQEPDRDPGRAEQDPDRGPRKACGCRAGADPHRGRAETENDGDPELKWQTLIFSREQNQNARRL